MADVTAQHAHRSFGCRAWRPVAGGWKVAEVTQLWLAGAQGPASDDFTCPSSAAELWSHNGRAWAQQRWSRVWKNNGDKVHQRWRLQREAAGKCKSDWCVETDEGRMWAKERERRPGSHVLSFSFTLIPLTWSHPVFLAWRKPASGEKTISLWQKHLTFTQLLLQCNFEILITSINATDMPSS